MSKIHNTKNKILIFLLKNKTEEFTIRSISKEIQIDYKTVYLNIQKLIENQTIISKKVGKSTLCSINQIFNSDVYVAEYLRKEELIKNKNLNIIIEYFKEIKDPFHILLLFGSYAKNIQRKKSDIDIMLITDNKNTIKKAKDIVKLIPKEIHLVNFTSEEFRAMLKTTEFNVGKEAVNNNIILYGIENYYKLKC